MLSDGLRTQQGIIFHQNFLTVSDLDFPLYAFLARYTTVYLFIFIILAFFHLSLFLFIRLLSSIISLFIAFQPLQDVVVLLGAHIFLSGIEEVLDDDVEFLDESLFFDDF